MKNYIFLILAALVIGCGPKKQHLNVFIWAEDLDPKIITDFETQFRCLVILDHYDSVESLTAKLTSGGDSLYDIVKPGDLGLPPLIRRGVIAPLRRENVPNLKNIDAQLLNQPFDPAGQYGGPYEWGTVGIYMRMPKGKVIDETWGLFFDPTKESGPFVLTDDPRSCIGAALQYQGHSVNSTDFKELAEARGMLLEAKGRSVGLTTAPRNSVLARSVTMSIANDSVAVRGEEEDPETRYFIPREGGIVWVSILCIPAKAPHRDLAENFINFILDAKVSARLANLNRNATANIAAMEFINPSDRVNPTIYPPPEVRGRLEFTRDLGEFNKLYDELWTQIKAK